MCDFHIINLTWGLIFQNLFSCLVFMSRQMKAGQFNERSKWLHDQSSKDVIHQG